MSNYLSPFERWQAERFGNIIPEQQQEEYEYRNIESREAGEWMEREAENELNQD